MSVAAPLPGHERQPWIQAPIVRFQTMLAMTGHRRIDVLKVDVEGTEFEIFSDSAREWLAAAPPSQIAIEFHEKMFKFQNATGRRDAVTSMLRRCGYHLRWQGTDDTLLYVRVSDASPHECAANAPATQR